MTEQELITLGRDCYAVFNAVPPPVPSRAWALWGEMCASVPLKAAPHIRAKIMELDSMPRNFGKFVLQSGREWLAQGGGSGGPDRRRECCPECEPRMPGYFYGWTKDSAGLVHSCLCRCLCNDDPALGKMPRMSREYAASRDICVMPVGYPGGPSAFEQEVFGMAGRGVFNPCTS